MFPQLKNKINKKLDSIIEHSLRHSESKTEHDYDVTPDLSQKSEKSTVFNSNLKDSMVKSSKLQNSQQKTDNEFSGSKEVTDQGTPHKMSEDNSESALDDLIKQFKEKLTTEEYTRICQSEDVQEFQILTEELFNFIKNIK